MAQTAKYTPGKVASSGATVTGKAKVNKVGNLVGDDLKIYLSEGSMDLVDRKDDTTRTRLKGVPILSKFERKKGQLIWSGICFWFGGKDREQVAGKNSDKRDLLILKNGETIVGRIKKVERRSITVVSSSGTKELNVEEVKDVKSPFAFRFTCKIKPSNGATTLAQAVEGPSSMQFSRTFDRSAVRLTKESKPEAVSSGMSKRKKIIISVVAVTLIAAAIAIPLAVAIPVSNQNRRRRNAQRNQEQVILQNLLQQQQQNPQPQNNN